jgi:uncharacterized protein YecE (DUF72 family)
MAAPELRIGTSGWNYGDWKGHFYPEDVKSREYLQWYSQHFGTVEVNYSFYHLPRRTTYENWSKQVPENFLFAVKASRFITHIKRLSGVKTAWRKFWGNAKVLGKKLGPILFQFPPSFKIDKDALDSFLEACSDVTGSRSVQLAFEFRHKSWFEPEVYKTLRKYRAALVVADSNRYPLAPLEPAAGFVYVRFHGPGKLFASNYSDNQLKEWAGHIKDWLSDRRDVYVYFNNDFHGYAIDNARTLAGYIG